MDVADCYGMALVWLAGAHQCPRAQSSAYKYPMANSQTTCLQDEDGAYDRQSRVLALFGSGPEQQPEDEEDPEPD